MFGLFKSKRTRRNGAWIKFHADVIRNSLQGVWAVQRTLSDAPDFQKLQDRLFSDTFAGYLFGFSEVVVSELAQDNPTRAKYSRMFFDAVITKRGGDWVSATIVEYVTSRPTGFEDGFHAGVADARDFINSTEPKALARLGKFFFLDKGLAA
jgi:hypothetical protein